MTNEIELLRSRILAVTTNNQDTELLRKAINYAVLAHKEDTRDEGTPYIYHPLEVAEIVASQFGIVEVQAMLLSVLHDVPEKVGGKPNQTQLSEIGKLFGYSLAEELETLTTKIGLSRDERDRYYSKAISASTLRVKLVKLADRLHNVRSLAKNPDTEKVKRYIQETRTYYLPLADSVFPLVKHMLEEELSKLEILDGN